MSSEQYQKACCGLKRGLQLVAALLPFVSSQAVAAPVPLIGIGAITPCSVWTSTRHHEPAAKDLENWALGYFSGVEMGMSNNFLIGSDASSLLSGLDTQCLVEPNNSIADAIDVIVMRIKEGI